MTRVVDRGLGATTPAAERDVRLVASANPKAAITIVTSFAVGDLGGAHAEERERAEKESLRHVAELEARHRGG